MLQGAAYSSRPVYGHSHYKKFWLKKMETEDEKARFLPPEPDPQEGFGRGIFCKGKSSLDVSFSSSDMNFSPLEIKSNGRSSNGVSSLRSGTQEFSSFDDEGREGLFDCALSIGMQTPSEKQRDGEEKYETQYSVRNLQNEDDVKKSEGIQKLRIHSLKRLLHSDGGDLQIGADKMTEIEFCEGTTVTRTCSDCKTNRTPLWRNGPNGPKSLCNACGIRYKKIRKRSVGNGDRQKSPPKFPSSVHRLTKFNKRKQDAYDPSPPRKRNSVASSSLSAEIVARHDPYLNGGVARHDPFRNGTVARHDPFPNGGVVQEKQNCGGHVRMRSFAKDEEEGAVLLMGLSCGLVNA